MLPSCPPGVSSRPGTTVAELQQYLQKQLWIATSTTDRLDGDQGESVLMSSLALIQSLGAHPVFKKGSAQDILEGTLVLAVLDNLEARLQSPHKGASSTRRRSSSSTPPLDDVQLSNNLAVNALTYVGNITAGLMKAHCRSPEDAAPLSHEPFTSMRKALLPRLRQFLFAPHPQVVQPALTSAGILTGLAMLPGFGQLEEKVVFDRHPSRWVLARFLDSGAAATDASQQQLRSLLSGLRQALRDPAIIGPGCKPISVDFDFPAGSAAEVAVCDACGRHNYFPALVRWAWKEPCELKTCSGCKQRRYCRLECQKVHWKGHKQRCRAILQARQAAQPGQASK